MNRPDRRPFAPMQAPNGPARSRADETAELPPEVRRLPARLRRFMAADDRVETLSPSDQRMLEEIKAAVLTRDEREPPTRDERRPADEREP